MKNYERRSFFKVFLSYFISVSIFVLILGYLYFEQQKIFVLQKSAMNMHRFLLQNKQSDFHYKKDGYSIKFVKNAKVEMALPQKIGTKAQAVYFKAFSTRIIVNIKANIIDEEIAKIKSFTIIIQIILIIIFAIISFLVAKMSLKPMSEVLSLLDNFTKDLIHDINTPITSILLNIKMLKKTLEEKELKKIDRIEQSAKNISSLYDNLEVILKDNKLLKEEINLEKIIKEIVETYKLIYPNIQFDIALADSLVYSNHNALKRILDNIISNSCKYSRDTNPTIKIDFDGKLLTIKDNGKGIRYPQNVFANKYTENSGGHGIGMYIVHRLCDTLSHKINIKSQEEVGTNIELTLS
jgi:two-component system OmpR family sensor kinase